MASAVANKEGLTWLFKEKYSFNQAPASEGYNEYLKSLLICANGDGELTQAERDWVIGYASAYGASDSLIEELKSYKASEDIEQVVSQGKASGDYRLSLIYDAIKACSADDDYNPSEQTTVGKMAAKLGITKDIVQEIESICQEEDKLRKKRLALMYPSGTPI
jgi:uncharacterized tellurite resistance protein B-like protein